MQLTMRPYQTEDDYWRIRAFLRAVFLLNDQRELCWHVARLDYWRWHLIERSVHSSLAGCCGTGRLYKGYWLGSSLASASADWLS